MWTLPTRHRGERSARHWTACSSWCSDAFLREGSQVPAARSTRRGCGRGQLDSTDSWTAHVRSVLLHLRPRLLYKAVFNAFSRTERLHVLVQTVVGPLGSNVAALPAPLNAVYERKMQGLDFLGTVSVTSTLRCRKYCSCRHGDPRFKTCGRLRCTRLPPREISFT